jgi:hypothetical protein
MNNYRKTSRIFGVFFILSFLSYGIGSSLIASIITVPDLLASVYFNQMQIIVGVSLMALVHTFTNIALPILMLPILKPNHKYLAFGYFSFAIMATLILVVGTLFSLLLIPLSEEYIKADSNMTSNFETMGILLNKASSFAYHMGMALWSIGGLLFVSALYQSKLIPKIMSVWGIIGYVVLLSGSMLEIYEHRDIVEIVSVIPGGLFEITLSVWFIVKSIRPKKIVKLSF